MKEKLESHKDSRVWAKVNFNEGHFKQTKIDEIEAKSQQFSQLNLIGTVVDGI